MTPEEVLRRTADDAANRLPEKLTNQIERARREGKDAKFLQGLEILFVRNSQSLFQSAKSGRHYTDRYHYLIRLLELHWAISFLIQPPPEDGVEDEPEEPEGDSG
jgi:hypothetical protein